MNTIILMVYVLLGSSLILHGTTAKTGLTQLVKRSQIASPAANSTAQWEHPLPYDNGPSTVQNTEGRATDPAFNSPSRLNDIISSPSKKMRHKNRHSSHHKTKRGEHKRRKEKHKPKCKCLSDSSSCDYNNESSETKRNGLHETDAMVKNESRRNKTYIKVDCLTLCQTYTCRVSELNSSQSKQRYDEIYSPNKSSETLSAIDGTMQSEQEDFKLWIICFVGIPICVVIIVAFSLISFQKRKEEGRKMTKASFREQPNIGSTESITKGDLFIHEYQCNKHEFGVNTVDASEKGLINLLKAKPRRSQCNGAKGVGTQYTTNEVDLLNSCSNSSGENINSKGRKYDYETKKAITFMKIASNKFSAGNTHQEIRESKPEDLGDDADTDRNQITCQESELANGIDVKVSIVKPLAAPADEKKEGATTPLMLNWDEIFRHLAKNLPTSDWLLFFNILYGNCHHLLSEGRDMGSYISRVENNVRRISGGVETLMFELFKQWKQLMGSDVNITCIEQALEERSYNSTLEDFRKFMRNPPLLPAISNRQRCQSFGLLDMNNTLDNKAFEYIPPVQPSYATFILPSVPQYAVPHLENRRTHMVTSGPIIQEMEDHYSDASSFHSSSSIPSSGRDSLSSSSDPNIGRKRKRLMLTRDIQGGEAQVTSRKQRRNDITGLPLKLTKELHEMKQTIIDMAKQCLPQPEIQLQAKPYILYLEHTIECIIKQTGEPRHKVLSLSHKDFCKTEMFETYRKEKFYFLYSGDCCLVLKHPQYETLRLYAEHARRDLVRDIKKKLDDKYKEPDALFLAHDGQPVIKKKKARKTLSNKEPTTREETTSCAAYDEEKHRSSSSANRGDTFEDTTNRFQKDEEYAESNDSQDGTISGISLGRNAVVKPYSTETKQPENPNLGVFNKQDKSLKTGDSLGPCKRELECVKHQSDQNTQQLSAYGLNHAVISTTQEIKTEIEYSQVCETETTQLNNGLTLKNENSKITAISNCKTVDKTAIESSVDTSEDFENKRSMTHTHILQHLTKTHNEGSHSTGDGNCEDNPTLMKMDTDILNEVFVSECEAVIHNEDLQENNFEINRCQNSQLSTIKLNDKRSKIGIDQETNDEIMSDDTKKGVFGTTKEHFSRTTSNSSSRTSTEDMSQTVGSISLQEIKEDSCSAVSKENISKTDATSSKTVLLSGETSSNELDDALVYACISSIMQVELGMKRNSREININIELD